MLNVRVSRDQRKYPRHRVFKEAKIASPTFAGVINVTIRELSVGGARLDTPPFIEIPNEFDLLVISENLFYPAVVRWCAGVSVGIEFAGEPHRPKVLPFSKPLQP
jgi:hypothetical protein